MGKKGKEAPKKGRHPSKKGRDPSKKGRDPSKKKRDVKVQNKVSSKRKAPQESLVHLNPSQKRRKINSQFQKKVETEKVHLKQRLEQAEPILQDLILLEERKKNLVQQKEEIAYVCNQILEDPEKNWYLLDQLSLIDNNPDPTIRKLALLSQFGVYKDILPGYRIRSLTDKELQVKHTREVKSLWEFEQGLLKAYQNYLQILESILKKEPKSSLVHTVAYCLVQLLMSRPNFNFSTNIVQLMAPLMDNKDEKVSNLVCDGIETIFSNNNYTELIKKIVVSISNYIKAKHFKCNSRLVESFLKLHITHQTSNIEKKKAKKKKEQKQLDQEMKDAGALLDTKNATSTEILNGIFVTYFRVLKKAHDSRLLPAVLKGLSRHAHFINIEMVVDVIDSLRNLLVNRHALSYENRLHIVTAAFEIIQTHDGLGLDLKDFYSEFYELLPHVALEGSSETASIVLRCLEIVFGKKHVSVERIGAFVKRLTTLCLQVLPHIAIAFLQFITFIFQKYPRTTALIDMDNLTGGVYLPEAVDPEHSNPFSTSLYEIFLLKIHYHPEVSRLAEEIITAKTLPHIEFGSWQKSLTTYNPKDGGFNPAIKLPTTHSYSSLLKKSKGKKNLYIRTPPPSKFLQSLQEIPNVQIKKK